MVFSKYHESWRDHPMINNSWKKMFPGFGHAVAIFTTYVALEFLYNKLYPPSHGHGHGTVATVRRVRGHAVRRQLRGRPEEVTAPDLALASRSGRARAFGACGVFTVQ